MLDLVGNSLTCILCRGSILFFDKTGQSKFSRHMQFEHGAVHDLEFMLTACKMTDSDRKALIDVFSKIDIKKDNSNDSLVKETLVEFDLKSEISDEETPIPKQTPKKKVNTIETNNKDSVLLQTPQKTLKTEVITPRKNNYENNTDTEENNTNSTNYTAKLTKQTPKKNESNPVTVKMQTPKKKESNPGTVKIQQTPKKDESNTETVKLQTPKKNEFNPATVKIQTPRKNESNTATVKMQTPKKVLKTEVVTPKKTGGDHLVSLEQETPSDVNINQQQTPGKRKFENCSESENKHTKQTRSNKENDTTNKNKSFHKENRDASKILKKRKSEHIDNISKTSKKENSENSKRDFLETHINRKADTSLTLKKNKNNEYEIKKQNDSLKQSLQKTDGSRVEDVKGSSIDDVLSKFSESPRQSLHNTVLGALDDIKGSSENTNVLMDKQSVSKRKIGRPKKDHKPVEVKKERFDCVSCDAVFIDELQLGLHRHREHREKKYSCKKCKKTFRLKATLKSHFNLRHKLSFKKAVVNNILKEVKSAKKVPDIEILDEKIKKDAKIANDEKMLEDIEVSDDEWNILLNEVYPTPSIKPNSKTDITNVRSHNSLTPGLLIDQPFLNFALLSVTNDRNLHDKNVIQNLHIGQGKEEDNKKDIEQKGDISNSTSDSENGCKECKELTFSPSGLRRHQKYVHGTVKHIESKKVDKVSKQVDKVEDTITESVNHKDVTEKNDLEMGENNNLSLTIKSCLIQPTSDRKSKSLSFNDTVFYKEFDKNKSIDSESNLTYKEKEIQLEKFHHALVSDKDIKNKVSSKKVEVKNKVNVEEVEEHKFRSELNEAIQLSLKEAEDKLSSRIENTSNSLHSEETELEKELEKYVSEFCETLSDEDEHIESDSVLINSNNGTTKELVAKGNKEVAHRENHTAVNLQRKSEETNSNDSKEEETDIDSSAVLEDSTSEEILSENLSINLDEVVLSPTPDGTNAEDVLTQSNYIANIDLHEAPDMKKNKNINTEHQSATYCDIEEQRVIEPKDIVLEEIVSSSSFVSECSSKIINIDDLCYLSSQELDSLSGISESKSESLSSSEPASSLSLGSPSLESSLTPMVESTEEYVPSTNSEIQAIAHKYLKDSSYGTASIEPKMEREEVESIESINSFIQLGLQEDNDNLNLLHSTLDSFTTSMKTSQRTESLKSQYQNDSSYDTTSSEPKIEHEEVEPIPMDSFLQLDLNEEEDKLNILHSTLDSFTTSMKTSQRTESLKSKYLKKPKPVDFTQSDFFMNNVDLIGKAGKRWDQEYREINSHLPEGWRIRTQGWKRLYLTPELVVLKSASAAIEYLRLSLDLSTPDLKFLALNLGLGEAGFKRYLDTIFNDCVLVD